MTAAEYNSKQKRVHSKFLLSPNNGVDGSPKEIRVVEGMPEKISSPRWVTKRIAYAVLFFCFIGKNVYLCF